MPPGMGHHRPTNISNPFNNFPQPHNAYQSSPYPQPNSNFQSHNFGGHPAFQPTHQNGQVNIFGSGLTNGGVPNNFGGATGLGGAGATGLASQEAQMRFQRGAEMQQAQDVGALQGRNAGMQGRIREVWKNNLDQEFAIIRSLIDKYPYVSMDTEFPGVVARPMGNFPSKADYHYQCLRCNVDLLKIIQLGITLFSAEGDVPPPQSDVPLSRQAYPNNLIPCPCTWTFNFKFSTEEDMANEDSIAMLRKAGVDFDKTAEMGIDPQAFGSLLITSGLVLEKDVTWLSFHSGYDFGYLIKVMSQSQLPDNEEAYLERVHMWFPRIYDIKYLFRHAQRLMQRGTLGAQASSIIEALGQKSGLQDIADALSCQREGRPHTAGSDAWLTGLVFWQMRRKIFDNQIPEDLVGMIWGLSGVGPPASAGGQAAPAVGQQTPNTNGASMYHTGMTPSTHKEDGPSTPQTTNSGLTSTPGPHGQTYAGGLAAMAGGGAYGNYQARTDSIQHHTQGSPSHSVIPSQSTQPSQPSETGADVEVVYDSPNHQTPPGLSLQQTEIQLSEVPYELFYSHLSRPQQQPEVPGPISTHFRPISCYPEWYNQFESPDASNINHFWTPPGFPHPIFRPEWRPLLQHDLPNTQSESFLQPSNPESSPSAERRVSQRSRARWSTYPASTAPVQTPLHNRHSGFQSEQGQGNAHQSSRTTPSTYEQTWRTTSTSRSQRQSSNTSNSHSALNASHAENRSSQWQRSHNQSGRTRRPPRDPNRLWRAPPSQTRESNSRGESRQVPEVRYRSHATPTPGDTSRRPSLRNSGPQSQPHTPQRGSRTQTSRAGHPHITPQNEPASHTSEREPRSGTTHGSESENRRSRPESAGFTPRKVRFVDEEDPRTPEPEPSSSTGYKPSSSTGYKPSSSAGHKPSSSTGNLPSLDNWPSPETVRRTMDEFHTRIDKSTLEHQRMWDEFEAKHGKLDPYRPHLGAAGASKRENQS